MALADPAGRPQYCANAAAVAKAFHSLIDI